MSVVIPIEKGLPHYERTGIREHTYRYGYQAIEGDDSHVSACVETSTVKYKQSVIHNKVSEYCKSVGIEDEWNPADYGFVGGQEG